MNPIRLPGTRISLDLILEQTALGLSPEEIASAYDSLTVVQVKAALAFYEWFQAEVDAYLAEREGEAVALRQQIEAERPRIARAELLARSE